MAFANKMGSLLRRTVTSNMATPSLFQAVRFMSGSKLFVGGVSYNTDEVSLTEAFRPYGEVVEARVILDRETGRSRGFAFVTFASSEEASAAQQAMDGKDLHGRIVKVNYANEKPSYGGGGGFGGGGGYGGGSGGYGGGGGGYGGGGYNSGGGYGGNSGGGGYNAGGGDAGGYAGNSGGGGYNAGGGDAGGYAGNSGGGYNAGGGDAGGDFGAAGRDFPSGDDQYATRQG